MTKFESRVFVAISFAVFLIYCGVNVYSKIVDITIEYAKS